MATNINTPKSRLSPTVSEQEDKRKYILLLYKAMVDSASNVEADMRDISSYITPRRGRFKDHNDVPDQSIDMSSIVSSAGLYAHRICAAGMYSGMANPTSPWFKLGFEDPDLMKWGPARLWLDTHEKLMYTVLARSNFYTQLHSLMGELCAFAVGALYEEEDILRVVRFKTFTAGEYVIGVDQTGRVDTLMRLFYMSADNMLDKFGESALTTAIIAALNSGMITKTFPILHACRPRRDRDLSRIDSKNKPYQSIYLDYKSSANPLMDGVLNEGGYDEFPMFVPRWEVIGSDVNGKGPGHDVLPDVKMLQDVETSNLKALHKTLDPPMLIPSGFIGRLNLLPGAENYYDETDLNPVKPMYQIQYDVGATEEKVRNIKREIREGYYNDVFLAILNNPYGQPPTATEIAERHEEKLLMLGPVIERQHDELYDPCIDRTWNIMDRKGMISSPPREISEAKIKVRYISVLAQAQKRVTARNVDAIFGFVAQNSAVYPQMVDKLNPDAAVDEVADSWAAPATIINDDKEVTRIREERKEAEQERLIQDPEQMKAGADMLKAAGGPEGAAKMAEAGAQAGIGGMEGGG